MRRRLTLVLAMSVCLNGGLAARRGEWRPRVSRLPCRRVVTGTLLGAIERGWDLSPTFKQQCTDLAAARAVVSLSWGQPTAQWHARTRMGREGGVMVAYVGVPPVEEAIGYVAHELEHVLARIRGVDFEAASKRAGSGVWRAASGDYETQAAIDAGRRVW